MRGRPDPLCVEFACSPRVRVALLRVLRFPPTLGVLLPLPLTKALASELELVHKCCTVAAHCS